MVLVDTSVWIDHFRNKNKELIRLLNNDDVFCHPFIIGEIACGRIENRTEILTLLKSLPQSSMVDHDEILIFIENNHMMGLGMGYIDIAILASAKLSSMSLWTLDKKLKAIATKFDIHYTE